MEQAYIMVMFCVNNVDDDDLISYQELVDKMEIPIGLE